MPQQHVEDAVDQFIVAQMGSQHIPGLALALIQGGTVVRASGYGFADLELDVRVTPDTVFEIGSLTKQFTATAVMMLVEEGKIGLDKAITHYQQSLPALWECVTVRQLLDHTSGIKSFTSIPEVVERLIFLPVLRDEVLALIADEPLAFAPGDQYAYSNTGYYLLGHIIEEASGQSYGDFLHERIFAPLGMDATRVNDMDEIIPRRANGYVWAENKWWNARPTSMTWAFSAGALASTLLDLVRWGAALGDEGLLSKSSWDRMWTPATLTDGTKTGYGFGWRVSDHHGHRHLGHDGISPGFSAFMDYSLEEDCAVIILTNVVPSNRVEIAEWLAEYYASVL